MQINDDYKSWPKENPSPQTIHSYLNSRNLISIYTIFHVLLKIRKEVGLEAMLDYIDKYLSLITTHNPRLKLAVTKAISLMNIEKMYKDVMCDDEREIL